MRYWVLVPLDSQQLNHGSGRGSGWASGNGGGQSINGDGVGVGDAQNSEDHDVYGDIAVTMTVEIKNPTSRRCWALVSVDILRARWRRVRRQLWVGERQRPRAWRQWGV